MLALFAHYGVFAIGLLILLESAGLPVPGETALAIGAMGAAQGLFPIWTVISVAALAALIGASVGYWAGQRFGHTLITRYGRRLRITPVQLVQAERFMERHGLKAVFLGRFSVSLRVLVGFLAGVAHLPPRRFLAYTTVGSISWALLIGGLAYVVGRNLTLLESWLRQLGWGAPVLGGIVVLLVIFWRRRGVFLAAHRGP